MSIFHWLRGNTKEPELSPDLVRRLIELDERQKAQERQLKALDMEWSEWYEKFRLMYARLAKRIKDAADVVGDGPESNHDAPGPTIDPPPSPGYGHAPMKAYGTGRRNY